MQQFQSADRPSGDRPSEDRVERLWILAFLLVLAVSVLKAFRLPIEYPATLMLFDYSAGFIRRGLFGTLVFPGGGAVSYGRVAAVAVGIFLALMAVLASVSIWIIRRFPALRLVPLLFAASLGVVFAAGSVGYFDHLLLLIAAAPLLLTGVRARLALALAGSGLALLVHEAALFITAPVLLAALALSLTRWRLPVLAGAALALGMGALAVVNLGTLGPEAAEAQQALIAARADFPLSPLAFEIVSQDPYAHAARWTAVVALGGHVLSLLIVAPSLLPLLVIALGMGRRMGLDAVSMLAVGLACLSPILLRFAGVDLQRWDTLAITTSYLTLALLLRDPRGAGAVPATWPALQPVLAGAIAISAASRSFLFEGQTLSLYPFLEVIGRAQHWLAGL